MRLTICHLKLASQQGLATVSMVRLPFVMAGIPDRLDHRDQHIELIRDVRSRDLGRVGSLRVDPHYWFIAGEEN